MIDSRDVERTFRNLLFSDDEIVDGCIPDDAVKVDGIVSSFGLHPGRVASSKKKVASFLLEMDDKFMKSGGGGCSFLVLCKDKNGNQWTSMHKVMEALCVMAIATGQGSWCLPREFWSSLPGGMPYIVFDPDKESGRRT